MKRSILYEKIRSNCWQGLNGYLVHPTLMNDQELEKNEISKEKTGLSKYIIPPSLDDSVLGVTAAAYFGYSSDSSLNDEPFKSMK
mmetsp:Transcript_24820/g.24323  ORF Transcript_24820/g.24323 Transcript_24820/m.24323 type:complete len:85 (+) Transcript_24820:796-1050(+)